MTTFTLPYTKNMPTVQTLLRDNSIPMMINNNKIKIHDENADKVKDLLYKHCIDYDMNEQSYANDMYE